MPEQSAGEKTFSATPHRRAEARKKGTVAKSMELSGAVVFLAIILAIRSGLSSGSLVGSFEQALQQSFAFNPRPFDFTIHSFTYWQLQSCMWVAKTLLPILGVAFAVGLAANIAQVGLVVSMEAAAPDWSRVSPAKGFERLFSIRGTVELLKGIVKIFMIGVICWNVAKGALPEIMQAGSFSLTFFLSAVGSVIWEIAIKVAVLLASIAVADFAFQKFQYEKMMKMSREEMRQEVKQMDGDPMIKQRIRQKQRELAKNRMMHDVPKADVIITNPTHFAIALKYDPKTMSAPRVIAKGADEVAQQIKRIGQESNVPLVENRPLAQALFHTVKIGKEVPSHLFRAVAEVLAFIYRTHGRRQK